MQELTITSSSDLLDGDFLKKLFSFSEMVSKSPIIPYTLRGKPDAVFTILLMAKEINLPPMQALNNVDVISGKPTMNGKLMLAMVHRAFPGKVKVDTKTDHSLQTAEVTLEIEGRGSFTSFWDMDRAKMLGLANKDNYKKQPVTMLMWRATSEAIRVMASDVVLGFYVPEELQDFDGNVIEETTPAEQLEEDFPIPEEEKVKGPFYRMQNGKFRSKQLGEFLDEGIDHLEKYHVRLCLRIEKPDVKDWEGTLHYFIGDFLENKEIYQECWEEQKAKMMLNGTLCECCGVFLGPKPRSSFDKTAQNWEPRGCPQKCVDCGQ